jgi:AcrR family transcriptional regulator
MSTRAPRRRTQEERSAATRAALLDATIDCLIELGYDRTTTARVAERAGVSRGAHLHHFQTRAALVATAIEQLTWRWVEQIHPLVQEIPTGPERVERGLDLLWRLFASDLFVAILDISAAARTDEELAVAMKPMELEHGRGMLLMCRALFAAGPDDSSVDPLIAMTLSTVRGLAILPLFRRDRAAADAQWPACRERLAYLYAREGAGTGETSAG